MLKTCKHCQKEFESVRDTAKYCSAECRNLAFRKGVSVAVSVAKDSVASLSVAKPVKVVQPKAKITKDGKVEVEKIEVEDVCYCGGIVKDTGDWMKAKTTVVKTEGNRVCYADGSFGDRWMGGHSVVMKHIHHHDTCKKVRDRYV